MTRRLDQISVVCTEKKGYLAFTSITTTPTLRSSRLAGRGPGLTGEMLLWLGYVFLTGDEELLLAVLDGALELQADTCSLAPLVKRADAD